jgi:hypothetical protein
MCSFFLYFFFLHRRPSAMCNSSAAHEVCWFSLAVLIHCECIIKTRYFYSFSLSLCTILDHKLLHINTCTYCMHECFYMNVNYMFSILHLIFFFFFYYYIKVKLFLCSIFSPFFPAFTLDIGTITIIRNNE